MKQLLFLLLLICASCKDEVETPSECIDPDHWGVIEGCYKIYDPVCGCNNVTYSNDCEAKVAGVTSWAKGSCPK